MHDLAWIAAANGTVATREADKREAYRVQRDKALKALEIAFVAIGRQGANRDIDHPLRPAWEAARAALIEAGRV